MKLYHATFSKLLKKIQKQGYLGNSPYKLWSDSDNRYVYLASDPDEAYSYAETALDEIDNEKLYDMLEDDEIVVLETDTKYLDKNKLFKDKNVIDGETTYQYEGIINCQCLRIFDMNRYNNEIEECLRIAGVKLNESENLTKWNRIAGFYHLDTKEFELFPRTTKDIDDEDDIVNDYIHNVHSKDEFTEFHIVRFGIENIPGEGVVCYIEGDTKRHAEECYYAIIDEYAEDLDIIKYEVSYYIGNKQKMDIYDRYSNQIMESLNESYGRMDRPFIWNDPTYSQFHRILRDNTTYGKLSAIIDNGHIYCWDSALSHHDSVVKDIEESGIKLSDDYIWVRFKEPNLCWVSAAYFDDYTDEDLEDLPQQDFEKELEENPIIKKYFPQGVKVVRFDNINESIAYVSKKDLSDIILKNPTKRELRENNLTLCRCMEDSEGNWYFADMENMLHAYIVSELRDEAYFPLFDGNDCYGIAYYDAESNEFWYNLNDYMYKQECIEQYNNSEYLRTTFPNARVIPNPWNNQDYDELDDDEELDDDDEELDEQLNEEIIHAEQSHYDDYMAVVLKNPTKRELRENGLDRSRFICFEDGTWLFFDSMQWIHAHIWNKYKDKFNGSNNMGFYDLSNNEFIFIEPMDYDEGEEGYEEEFNYYIDKEQQFLLSYPYIVNTFGKNFNIMVYGDWVDNPW